MRKVREAAAKKNGVRIRSAASAPTIVKRKVPVRQPNSEYRNREYLSEKEVARVIAAAAAEGRHGLRDSTLILIAYRHGLRVSELVSLRWDQIDLAQGLVHVARLKNGVPSVHPLRGPELRALRRLQREDANGAYVFVSERKAPLTPDAVRKIVGRAGREAGIQFSIHPHMLRHATGYKLANDGHDTRAIQQYLGHRNIQHTTRYTDLAPNRFKDFWRD
jgi:type 1 fimbriae regulatory protein FimE